MRIMMCGATWDACEYCVFVAAELAEPAGAVEVPDEFPEQAASSRPPTGMRTPRTRRCRIVVNP
jgi:hypothetical protein